MKNMLCSTKFDKCKERSIVSTLPKIKLSLESFFMCKLDFVKLQIGYSTNLIGRCISHVIKDLTVTSLSCKVQDSSAKTFCDKMHRNIFPRMWIYFQRQPRSFRTQVRCIQNWSCNLGCYASLDGMSQWSWKSKILLLFHKIWHIDSVKKWKIKKIAPSALSCNSL